MSKRPKEKLSYSKAMQDLMERVDKGGDKEDIQEINGEDDQDSVIEDAVSDEEDGTTDNEVEQSLPQKHRKTLTRSRNRNSIDALLNEDNFKPIHYVNGNAMWETLTGFLVPKSNKNTQTIKWQRNSKHIWVTTSSRCHSFSSSFVEGPCTQHYHLFGLFQSAP